MNSRIVLFVILLFAFSCENDASEVIPLNHDNNDEVDNGSNEEPDFSILFIGNSLTYYNDLPNLVKDVASQNDIIIATESVALSNYALIDHWNDGSIQNLIENQGFDFVSYLAMKIIAD